MSHKYVRFKNLGFIIWPKTDDVIHRSMARMSHEPVISAGFVHFGEGIATCYGKSESLGISSRPDDSEAMNIQMFDC
jgi:hypothetical protein